jgi:ATP-dependent RNA helicase DDX3X
MFFSATFPKPVRDLAKNHLAVDHVRLRVGRAGSTHENIKQSVILTDPALKKKALFDLLQSLPPTRTMIFVNSKRAVDELDDYLYNLGVPVTSIHSDRTQKEREASMRAFRSGTAPVLIATGVSARGIDVRNVMHVVNYDLPSMDHGGIEEYTHRIGKSPASRSLSRLLTIIGRTGRIGHRGLATSFYTDRDEAIASVLTRTLLETGQEIPDFLEPYMPEGEARSKLKFEADSDFEDDAADGEKTTEDGAWGADASESNDNAGGAWGSGTNAETEQDSGGW